MLGLIFGWAGAATALSLMGDVRYAVPWTDVGAVVAIALVAGLLASVLPVRAAARTSPVAALGSNDDHPPLTAAPVHSLCTGAAVRHPQVTRPLR
ncbi:hypothetical protein PSN13_01414 [Micromonospora saelicesensis]|uniref:Uncharacterized protein n=1 Tax=Micromonospora saelicesensis TaxID=285676 RepID=A0A328NWM0_9ACTN|nr:hypothetical protein PSN13_01414 [Micromonospora saelicesensis]